MPISLQMPAPLRAYQYDGVSFLMALDGGLLGDDMGLGKTIQAITALRMLVHLGRVRRAVLLCPASVLRNWEEEIRKWAPGLRIAVAHGEIEARLACWHRPAHIYMTTFDTARGDIEAILKGIAEQCPHGFDVMIIDEAHNLKNPDTARYRAARRIEAVRRWGLTGTPLENRLEEAQAVFNMVHPGLFRTSRVYDAATVRDTIKPHFLRRRKADVLQDLPQKIHIPFWLELLGSQRRAYDRAYDIGVVHLENQGRTITVQHVLALIGQLRQICNFTPDTTEGAKVDWLVDNIDEMLQNEGAVLVFSSYVAESGVASICRRLEGYSPLTITGDMSATARHSTVQRFTSDPDSRILVLSHGAGGVGINLQKANYVVHFDHPWTPAKAAQAEDRSHRMGQTRQVTVYHLWTANTIEHRVFSILERKRKLYNEVIDDLSVDGEDIPLTEDELFGLFGMEPPEKERAGKKPTLADLLDIDPRRFEALVSDLWQAMGFETQLTPPTGDAGIDVIAVKSDALNPERYAIQCKRHRGPIGRPDAQKLLGAVSNDPRFLQGVLVAVGGFTPECVQYARQNGRVRLIGGDELLRLCDEHGVDPRVYAS